MSLVSVHTEWDPLEEVIVGIADNARIPSPDLGLFAVDYADSYENIRDIPTGGYAPHVVDETREDLDAFVAVLESCGVIVRRPEPWDHSRTFSTPDWSADGEYNYCPRDVLLAIGETVIEAPMVLRTRYFETLSYRRILLDYFKSGANWISAPKPRLLDSTYAVQSSSGSILRNHEPLFDAANVLRVGRDILFQISRSGNMLGCQWLQRVLGSGYRIHAVEDIYDGTHLDTTISPIRPGLVVLNPERVRPDNVPALFRNWEIIWCPPLDDPSPERGLRATTWMAMNLLMINPELAVVDAAHRELITELERHGVSAIPLKMRHSRRLSGGFHCVSADIRRSGRLEDYS